MASQKLHKITKIMKETNATSDHRYNIDGIDTSIAKFMWREPTLLFRDLAPGDYRIEEIGNSRFVVITSDPIKAVLETFQVAYVIDFTASTYETDYDVDINTLKNKYNQLVSDSQFLWDYVRNLGFVADESGFNVILPQLNTGEVWMKAEDGWKGFNVSDIESNITDFWNRFDTAVKEAIDTITAARDQAVGQINSTGNTQNDRVTSTGNTQVDRISSASSNVDNRLQLIWRMYSVLTGSQRYLSGNVLLYRDITKLEKTVDGGNIASRSGNPKRIYDGGNLSNRTIKAPLVVDLGEYI